MFHKIKTTTPQPSLARSDKSSYFAQTNVTEVSLYLYRKTLHICILHTIYSTLSCLFSFSLITLFPLFPLLLFVCLILLCILYSPYTFHIITVHTHTSRQTHQSDTHLPLHPQSPLVSLLSPLLFYLILCIVKYGCILSIMLRN